MSAQQGMAIEKLNPLNYMGAHEYTTIWQKLFATLLYGFWGRLFFILFMFMAFYVGVRQRNPTLAAIFLMLAAAVAYGGGAIDIYRMVTGG